MSDTDIRPTNIGDANAFARWSCLTSERLLPGGAFQRDRGRRRLLPVFTVAAATSITVQPSPSSTTPSSLIASAGSRSTRTTSMIAITAAAKTGSGSRVPTACHIR
jgi:hypothetical protein